MRQLQFAYEDYNSFVEKIENVREFVGANGENKVLFKVFCDILLTDNLDDVLTILSERFPFAQIAGCTTNGNVIDGCWSKNINIIVHCIVFEHEDTFVDVVSLDIKDKSAEEIESMLKDLRLDRPWAQAVEFFVSMKAMSYENFHAAFKNLKSGLLVFGGGAYNKDMIGDRSYVFTKDCQYTKYSMILTFYGGSCLQIKTDSVVGWKPLGRQYEITKAKDNILYEVDGRPAVDIYSRYLNVKNDSYFNVNSIEFPFLCSNIDGYEILRTPVSANADDSILMFSRVDDFKYLRLTYGDPDTILQSVKDGVDFIEAFNPETIFVYSCVARKAFWGENIDKETYPFQKLAPTCGFFTSGELLSSDSTIHHLNETMVIVGMKEGDSVKEILLDDEEEIESTGEVPLISRLVHFIGVATSELEEARMEADKANKAKSDFLANMSHEIRTPINAVLGLDTMILRSNVDETVKTYANDILEAGQNLLNIINDILDLSKIESGNMELVPAEYNTLSVISDVNNMVAVKALDKGLSFNIEVDDDVPSALYGDEIRIKQIIVNLVNNAVKYTDEGSVTFSLKLLNVNENKVLIRISVKDTGIGIKEEDLNNLFVKFKRIEESRNRSVEGTGLGMNIAIQFLKLMNSELMVKSTYGEGSEFSFEIEQEIVDPTPMGDFNEKLKNKKVEYSYSHSFEAPMAHILVVDDNSLNRKVISSLLEETKINIDTADGGLTCLERTLKKKYDLILLDHMMPDLDGVQTLKRIRENSDNPNCDIPIVALTANALTGAKEEYMSLGFNGFISKPVDPEKLEKSVSSFLPPEKILLFSFSEGNRNIDDDFFKSIKEIQTLSGCLDIDSSKVILNKLSDYCLSESIMLKLESLLNALDDINLDEIDSICEEILKLK